MTQSGVIAATLLGGFVAFIVLKGRVGVYADALRTPATPRAPLTFKADASKGKTYGKGADATDLAGTLGSLLKETDALRSAGNAASAFKFVMGGGA